jgi:hypothetical protein
MRIVSFGKLLAHTAVLTIAIACLVSPNIPAHAQATFSLFRAGQMPIKRMMHGTAIVGTRIYLIGGNGGTSTDRNQASWLQDVVSAEILPNGTLSEWRPESSLPSRRAYIMQSVETINNRIYVVGGSSYRSPNGGESDVDKVRTAIFATVGPDGKLSDWQESDPFPTDPVSNAAVCASDKNLFLIGGLKPNPANAISESPTPVATESGNRVSDSILASDIGSDGKPTNWREIGKLPKPLWFHGAAIVDDRIFVWGGLPTQRSQTVNRNVWSAKISDGPTVGEWIEESPMPYGVYSAAYCGFNDYLVAVGGRYTGALPTNAIWFNRLTNGKTGEWKVLTTDLAPRLFHSLGLDRSRSWVFVPGGLDRRTARTADPAPIVDTVQAFQLPQPATSRLVVATDTTTHAPPPSTASVATGSGFLPLDEALRQAAQANTTVLGFFYSPETPASKRVWETVIQTPQFRQFAGKRVLAAIDVSVPGARTTLYKYSIFKVPSLVELSAQGNLLRKADRVTSLDDVGKFLNTN